MSPPLSRRHRPGLPRPALSALLALGLVVVAPAWGLSVSLQGTMGERALLVIDGGAPRALAPGQSHAGVKLLSVQGSEAWVEVAGQRRLLRIGDTPATVGVVGNAPGRGSRIVLTAGPGGHFWAEGSINGRAAQFMLDTGATAVTIGRTDAERMGLKLDNAPRTRVGTANGVAGAWVLTLDSVRVGDVEVLGVQALVMPQPMPYVLLGNSFLGRFRMQRDGQQLTLERRF